jgi:hypothetical protein
MTQMGKYLPGKIWSYAFQMLLLKQRGVPKSYVLYINAFTTISLLLTNALFAFSYIALRSPSIPTSFSVLVAGTLAAAYCAVVLVNGKVAETVVLFANRIFRRPMEFYKLPFATILKIQASLLVTNLLFGLAGCAACYSIGWAVPNDKVLSIASVTLLSDLVGFIMVVSPGGLGIREGAMFFLLSGIAAKRVALLLPLAIRIITMTADLLLWLGAMLLYYTITGKKEKQNRGT